MKKNSDRRTEASRRHHLGFSLLELLIVLAVIAGLVAIAWPNLRKPLNDTPLSQAASNLRELFDECRYQAVLRGELTMLRLQQQSSAVVIGSWEALLANQLELPPPVPEAATDTNAAEKNLLLSPRRPPFQFQFTLPPDIVVEQVVWSAAAPESSEPASPDDSEFSNDSEFSGDSLSGPAQTAGFGSNTALQETELSDSGFWYVPFTPAGVSKDVSVVLQDTTTLKRIALQYKQGTGLMTIVKLPDAAAANDDNLLSMNR